MKATPASVLTRVLDVISVPSGHPYVRHLLPPDASSWPVRYRADPDPDDPARVAGARWWPPPALQPRWVGEQCFDLLHVHFGFDDRTPQQLSELLDVMAERGRPVVLTIHDLRNPHHRDPGLLEAQLDVLVPRVSALLTLTSHAASIIWRRWRRHATVVPHPHVVDLATMATVRDRRRAARPRELLVGVAVKELRTSSDPLRVLPAVASAVRRQPRARLRVTAHHEVRARTDSKARELVAYLDRLESRPGAEVEVVWHEPWSDDELWRELASLHVAVLPYRFGTHSGWLEACHDVGTRVLAPSFGCYADQGADGVYEADEHRVDEDSLVRELGRLLSQPPQELPGSDAALRLEQRSRVAHAHEQLYRDLLAASTVTR